LNKDYLQKFLQDNRAKLVDALPVLSPSR
jgi:hypothetical protein